MSTKNKALIALRGQRRQGEFAHSIVVDGEPLKQARYSRYESGSRRVPLEVADAIREAFGEEMREAGLSLEDLMRGTVPERDAAA